MTKHLDAADLAAPFDAGQAEGERLAAGGENVHRESVVDADRARNAERTADLLRRHNASIRGAA